MAETEWVELSHPQVEGTYRAPATAVEHYKSAGWVPVSSSEPKATAAPKAPEKKAEA